MAFVEALDEPAFRISWIAHLSRELRRVRTQNERLSLHTAQERITHFIETEGEDGRVTLNQSRKQWAAELGLTHEALYRALARMAQSGVVRIDGAVLALCPRPPGQMLKRSARAPPQA
jgi:CRP-like cAMP-binding protein